MDDHATPDDRENVCIVTTRMTEVLQGVDLSGRKKTVEVEVFVPTIPASATLAVLRRYIDQTINQHQHTRDLVQGGRLPVNLSALQTGFNEALEKYGVTDVTPLSRKLSYKEF